MSFVNIDDDDDDDDDEYDYDSENDNGEKFDDIGDNNNKQIKEKIKHDNNNKILKKKSSSRQALFVSSHAIKDVQRLTKRVMHLQTASIVLLILTLSSWIATNFLNVGFVLKMILFVFILLTYILFALILYGNFSIAVFKAKLKSLHFWIVLFFQAIIAIVDLSFAKTIFNVFNLIAYVTATMLILLVDTMEVKKRSFCITIALLFVILSLYNITNETLGNPYSQEIVLQLSTHGISKSVVRKMVYMNTFFMTLKGIIILFKDTKQEKLMFLTKPVFRFKHVSMRNIQRDKATSLEMI